MKFLVPCTLLLLSSAVLLAEAACPHPEIVTINDGDNFIFMSHVGADGSKKYPNKQDCRVEFKTGPDCERISVSFDFFNIYSGYSKCKDANSDFLSIKTPGSTFDRYCKKKAPVLQDMTDFRTKFYSNRNKKQIGFKGTVTCSRPATTPSPVTEPATTTTPDPTMSSEQPGGSCMCGIAQPLGQRIVGGQDAEEGEWPWQAQIRDNGAEFSYCGAVLISDKWVLTAAHCLDGESPSGTTITLGDYSEFNVPETEGNRVDHAVKNITIHPNYNSFTTDYDIALVELTEPVDFDAHPHIRPACWPTGHPAHGENVTVTGQGTLNETGIYYAAYLQEVEVEIISNAVCSNSYSSLTPRMFCAGFEEGGKDSCQGDSGGPVVHEVNGHWELVGLVSWGIGCARPNFPGVYAKVFGDLADWAVGVAREAFDKCAVPT